MGLGIFQNCWEYWNCEQEKKEQCPAFQYKTGQECWRYARTVGDKMTEPKKDLIGCFRCSWYQRVSSFQK